MAGPKTENKIAMMEIGLSNCETFQMEAILYKKFGQAAMFQIQAMPITNHKGSCVNLQNL
jgi:hypothetical protein